MSCGFPAGFLRVPAVFQWVFRGQKDRFMTPSLHVDEDDRHDDGPNGKLRLPDEEGGRKEGTLSV